MFYRWVKRCHLKSALNTRRIPLQTFIEKQLIRTRARTSFINQKPKKKVRNQQATVLKETFFGARETWKKRRQAIRQPKYLKKKFGKCTLNLFRSSSNIYQLLSMIIWNESYTWMKFFKHVDVKSNCSIPKNHWYYCILISLLFVG